MHIRVNPSDERPIYRQIMQQIMDAIAGGRLRTGDRLPSHRELSEQLVIAPLTVKKAYDELESLGFIDLQRGRGTFVSARFPRVTRAVQAEQVAEAARALLTRAYLAGLDFQDVLKILREADRDISDGPAPTNRKRG